MPYLGKTPSPVPVDASDIPDNSITTDKLAGGTDGELITYDTAGDPAKVAVGTSGHVLTSGGAGVAPTFQAAAAGGVDGIVSSADATAITIDSSENVGIGTSSPSETLHVYSGTTDKGIVLENILSPSIRLDTTDTDSNARNWKIRTNVFAYGDFNILRGTTQGGVATTSALTITNDGRGLSQFTAKVWVNFRGTSSVLIRDSHNISSITDNGNGDYSLNFSSSLGNSSYSVVGMANESGSYGYVDMYLDRGFTMTTSSCRVQGINHSSTYTDPDYVMMQVFGD